MFEEQSHNNAIVGVDWGFDFALGKKKYIFVVICIKDVLIV